MEKGRKLESSRVSFSYKIGVRFTAVFCQKRLTWSNHMSKPHVHVGPVNFHPIAFVMPKTVLIGG
jgi:hypothetical protein